MPGIRYGRGSGGTWRRTVRVALAAGCTAGLWLGAGLPEAAAVDLPYSPGSPTPWFYSLQGANNPDWMGALPGGTALGALSIPGTHDTLAIHGSWAPGYWQTQENHGDSADTLTAQLNAGIRSVDIRVRIVNSNTAFAIHHTNTYENANFDDVLSKAKTFLAVHPGETVLMNLHGECDGDTTEGGTGGLQIGKCVDDPANATGADRVRIFNSYLARYPGLFYAPSVSSGAPAIPTPTLGQARGHVVLNAFSGPVGESYAGFGIPQLATTSIPWTLCDPGQRWALVQTSLQQVAADITGTLGGTGLSASCPPFGSTYAQVANPLNQLTMNYLQSHSGHTGTVVMDWPGSALIGSIISHNAIFAKPGKVYGTTRHSDGSWSGVAPVPTGSGLGAGFSAVQESTAATANGSTVTVAIDVFGFAWTDTVPANGQAGGWLPVDSAGGGKLVRVAATGLPGGDLELMAVQNNGTVLTNQLHGANWQGWSQVPGGKAKVVTTNNSSTDAYLAAAAQPNGTTQVVAYLADNNLWRTVRNLDGSWQPWALVPGASGAPTFAGHDVALAATPDGNLQIATYGLDGYLRHTLVHPDGGWSGWGTVQGANGASLFAGGDLSFAALPDGSTQLIALGLDQQVYHTIRYANGAWSPWGQVPGSYGAASIGAARLSIAARADATSTVTVTTL